MQLKASTWLGLAAGLILSVTSSKTMAKIQYTLVDLGGSGDYYGAYAYSVNNHGQIVGFAYDHDSDDRYGMLFDSTGNQNNIPVGKFIQLSSINDRGQIVGYSYDQTSNPTYSFATLLNWTGSQTKVNLGTLGGNFSSATSINDQGQIVGSAFDGSGDRYATLFDPTGAGRNIKLGAPGSDAYAINNLGQIVGYEAEESEYDYHATLFDPTGNGRNINLGWLEGPQYSMACSINDRGQIVGYSAYSAVLFDSTGQHRNIDLGTLGGNRGEARCINNAGQIVGIASDAEGNSFATLFDPTGNKNNINLSTLIDPSLGWTLEYASSINDQGWIVGIGYQTVYEDHAFLLIPIPEPATMALFILGGCMAKRRSFWA